MRESMDKKRIQGVSVGRAGNFPRSPYPSSTRSVDPATARRRRLNYPGDLLRVASATEVAARHPDRGAEVSRGIVGHVVGKASEALQSRKAESTDRLSRER